MTGLVVLDVFISLIFIFLLYSLFATTIVESVTSSFGSRGKNLLAGIDRMLSDDGNTNRFNYTFLNLFIAFRGNGFTEAFYKHPSIKFLAQKGLVSLATNRPSYIAPERFSAAMIDLLRSGDYDDEGENISASLGIIPRFDLKELQSRIDQLENDISQLDAKKDLFEFEAFSEELAYLKGDLQKKANRSSADILQPFTIDKETNYQLKSLWFDAANDIDKFKALIEKWYNEQMDRIVGWYKRKVTFLTFLIGLGLAITFKVDTIQIASDLSKNEDMRAMFVAGATQFLAQHPDSLDVQTFTQQKQYMDSVKNEIAKYNAVLSSQNEETDTWPGFGYLITAFAISLGAPFWFDLLNKLVKIRSSLQMPVAAKADAGKTETVDTKAVG
ncbi:MAG: hypothetical protein RIE86_02895 [Imperialibacter sp.]|uniref:hypothetical protein n=1 Tax=Imperialibacter sp. TaxID=2038411 RepID=UPI0032EE7CCB